MLENEEIRKEVDEAIRDICDFLHESNIPSFVGLCAFGDLIVGSAHNLNISKEHFRTLCDKLFEYYEDVEKFKHILNRGNANDN